MSKSSFSLANLSGQDVVTFGSSAALLCLYYSLPELGSDLNKKISTLAKVLKKVNRNSNVVDMHFKKHLISHKTELDDNDYNFEYIKKLEDRIKRLEELLDNSETVLNPIINEKIIKKEKDFEDDSKSFSGVETQPLWGK